MAPLPSPAPVDPKRCPVPPAAALEVVADDQREGTITGIKTMVPGHDTAWNGREATLAPLHVEAHAGGPFSGLETSATMPEPVAVPGVRPLGSVGDDPSWIGREATLIPGSGSQIDGRAPDVDTSPLYVPDGDVREGTMSGTETMLPGRDDAAWDGREVTLAPSRVGGTSTMSGASTMMPGGEAWAGREPTQGAGEPAPDAPSARDHTMTGVKTMVPGAGEPWLGREATLGDRPATPSSVPASASSAVRDDITVSGIKTLPPGAAGAWVGREATQADPALAGSVAPAPAAAARSSEPGTGTREGGSGTRGRTGTGKTRTGTAFDDAWHLEGRKGPYTGETWGDWAIGGLIGEGGMGAVYKAKQLSLGRRCALKVLASNLAGDQKLLKRFQMEARLTSMLSSPNIVAVYAAGSFEERHFFVMEYVEGTDLYDIIKTRKDENRPHTPAEAADIVLQSARGLAEAGRYGIVHRDIKPPNLMVTRQGLVKIADFGIVKVMGESSLTMTGQAVGTPSYVSPEQGRGQADIDQRSDLYSLGVVFYELLCGKKPFHGSTPNALIYQHCYAEPELPKMVNPAVPDEYQAVALRCLQKKPENRYQNADELIRDLEAIRAGNLMKEALASYKLGTGAKEAQLENMTWAQRHLLRLVAMVAVAIGGGGIGLYYYLDARASAREKVTAFENRLAPLDQPTPIPSGIDNDLITYASLSGHDARKLAAWKSKVVRVRVLAGLLTPLDQPAPPREMRQHGEALLKEYVQLVGKGDPNADRWQNKLGTLAAEEDKLREKLRTVDQSPRLTQAVRDSQARTLAELRTMAGAADGMVVRVATRFADYDARKTQLIAGLALLDQAGVEVTEAQYRTLSQDLAELREMLGDNDRRLSAWADRLTSSSEQVAKLRKRLGSLDASELPTVAHLRDLDKDFAALRKLVPANDPQLVGWEAKRAATAAEVDSLRARLLPTDQVDCLQDGAIEPIDQLVAKHKALVGDGDTDGLRWAKKVRDSRRLIGEQRDAFRRFERPEAFTVAELKDLAAVRDRLDALGAISEAQRTVASKRLADEAVRLQERRVRLKALDSANSLTAGLRVDLTTYAGQVGDQDADVKRWTAKAGEIEALLAKLAVLDRPAAIPDNVTALFDQLAVLVGANDANVVRWRAKAQRLKELLAELQPIDRIAPLPAGAEAGLRALLALVGDSDPAFRRWQDKVTAVRGHQGALAELPATWALGSVAHDQAHGHLAALIDLIGPEDPSALAAAARLAVLVGPGRPAWAVAAGRDQFGAWAELAANGVTTRLRFVPAGSFTLGSPAGESGRDADELAVPVTLSRSFWLAESECTQRQWTALMGSNPSRDHGDELPVTRVTWDDSQRFVAAINALVGHGLGARLPSEAEWEHAARAGSNGPFALPAGLVATASGQVADSLGWHAGNALGQSKSVKLRLPNPLGLYDVHGNVAEWCADRYGPYPTITVSDPVGRDGESRVVRGGSWGDPAHALRAANRTPARPTLASAYVGLRLAADATWPTADGRPDPAALIAGLGRDRAVVREVTIGDPAGVHVKVRVAVPAATSSKAAPEAALATESAPSAVAPAALIVPAQPVEAAAPAKLVEPSSPAVEPTAASAATQSSTAPAPGALLQSWKSRGGPPDARPDAPQALPPDWQSRTQPDRGLSPLKRTTVVEPAPINAPTDP